MAADLARFLADDLALAHPRAVLTACATVCAAASALAALRFARRTTPVAQVTSSTPMQLSAVTIRGVIGLLLLITWCRATNESPRESLRPMPAVASETAGGIAVVVLVADRTTRTRGMARAPTPALNAMPALRPSLRWAVSL